MSAANNGAAMPAFVKTAADAEPLEAAAAAGAFIGERKVFSSARQRLLRSWQQL